MLSLEKGIRPSYLKVLQIADETVFEGKLAAGFSAIKEEENKN